MVQRDEAGATGPSRGGATYSVKEAAALLGVSSNAAYEAVHRGEIPTIRIGRRILVPRAAFDRWLSGTPQ